MGHGHARTLAEVRQRLADPATATTVLGTFAAAALDTAFGRLGKSEADIVLFGAMFEAGVIGGSDYAMSRALNVPTARVRTLRHHHQLRAGLDDETLSRDILALLAEAKFSTDNKQLRFGIESPLHRALVEARLKERGVFADIALTGQVLRVPLAHVGDLLSAFFTPVEAKRLADRLRKEGLLEKQDLAAALGQIARGVARKGGEEVASRGWKAAMDMLVDAAKGGGGADGLPDLLSNILAG